MKQPRVKKAVSAGGVVYRRKEGDIQVALCGRRRLGTWNLPKGTPDDGETLEETAVREVEEETGLKVAIEKPLGGISYSFAHPPEHVRYNKTVHFYLMAECGGSTELHDPEFDMVRWFPAEDALKVLTHANEVDVLRRALDSLGQQEEPHD